MRSQPSELRSTRRSMTGAAPAAREKTPNHNLRGENTEHGFTEKTARKKMQRDNTETRSMERKQTNHVCREKPLSSASVGFILSSRSQPEIVTQIRQFRSEKERNFCNNTCHERTRIQPHGALRTPLHLISRRQLRSWGPGRLGMQPRVG